MYIPPPHYYPLAYACLKSSLNKKTDFDVNIKYCFELSAINIVGNHLTLNLIKDIQYIPILLALIKNKLNTDFLLRKPFSNYLKDLDNSKSQIKSLIDKYICKIAEFIKINTFSNMLGLTVHSSNYFSVSLFCLLLKQSHQEIKIILGGPQIIQDKTLRNILLSYNICDFCYIGEGEVSFPELCVEIENKFPNQLYYEDIKHLSNIECKDSNNQIQSTRIETVTNLNDLPYPNLEDYYEWIHEIYANHMQSEMYIQTFPIYTNRGCPFRCKFCSEWNLYGNRFRTKSVKRIVDEIEYYNKTLKITFFYFANSLIDQTLDHLVNIAKELLNRNIKIIWTGMITAGSYEREITHQDVDLLAKSGFLGAFVGLEETGTNSLNILGKGGRLSNFEKRWKSILTFLDNKNIFLVFPIIFGIKTYTFDDAMNSLKFLKDYKEKYPNLLFSGFASLGYYLGSTLTTELYANPTINITWQSQFLEIYNYFNTEEQTFLQDVIGSNHEESVTNKPQLTRDIKLLNKEISFFTSIGEPLNHIFHTNRIFNNLFGILEEEILLDYYPKFNMDSFSQEPYLKYFKIFNSTSTENGYISNIIEIGDNTLIFTKEEVNLLQDFDGTTKLSDIIKNKRIIFSEISNLLFLLTYYNLIQW